MNAMQRKAVWYACVYVSNVTQRNVMCCDLVSEMLLCCVVL